LGKADTKLQPNPGILKVNLGVAVDEGAAWVNREGAEGSREERAANLGAILATQAHWLTERLLDRQANDFENDGGFSERLYRARTGKDRRSVKSVSPVNRGNNGRRQETDQPDKTD